MAKQNFYVKNLFFTGDNYLFQVGFHRQCVHHVVGSTPYLENMMISTDRESVDDAFLMFFVNIFTLTSVEIFLIESTRNKENVPI